MKRELAFYLNPHGPDRKQIIRTLSEAGIRLIGTDGTAWDPEKDRTEIDNFRKELGEFGFGIYSMHACSSILAKPDEETPPELMKSHLKELRRFSILGGKTIVYHACLMADIPPENTEKAIESVGWERFIELSAKTIRKLAKEASKSGMTVVLENTTCGKHCESVSPIAEMIRRVNEPNLGICLDSGHTNLAGLSVADEMRASGKLLRDTHFHDNRGPVDGKLFDQHDPSRFETIDWRKLFDQHIPPGLGTINWQEACRALDEIEYPGPIVFEGVLGPGDSIEKGRFGGKLSHKDLVNITINNWRAFELLAEEAQKKGEK